MSASSSSRVKRKHFGCFRHNTFPHTMLNHLPLPSRIRAECCILNVGVIGWRCVHSNRAGSGHQLRAFAIGVDDLVHMLGGHRFHFDQIGRNLFQRHSLRRQRVHRRAIPFIDKAFHFDIDLTQSCFGMNRF